MHILTVVVLAGMYAALAPILGRQRTPPLHPALARALHALAAVGALAAAARFGLLVSEYLRANVRIDNTDFAIFYRAALAARAHAPLYDLADVRREAGEVSTYRHAPIGASLLAPLTLLPLRTAFTVWQALNLGLYLATLAGLLRHFRVDARSPLALGLVAVWFASAPTFQSLAAGQWDTLFLAASAAALVALARRRDGWAGAYLALPTALKFYPAALLLAPLLARRYRPLLGCALAGAALTLIGGLVAGWANTAVFLSEVVPATGGGTLYAENQTLYAFIGRLLASILVDRGRPARYPVALTTYLAAGAGLAILAVSALVASQRTGGPMGEALRFVLFIPAILLALPVAWVHYEEWALLAIFVLAVSIAREPAPARWAGAIAACFVAAVLLVPLGTERDVWTEGVHLGAVRLILTYKAYGLVTLWAGTALAAWRARIPVRESLPGTPPGGRPTQATPAASGGLEAGGGRTATPAAPPETGARGGLDGGRLRVSRARKG